MKKWNWGGRVRNRTAHKPDEADLAEKDALRESDDTSEAKDTAVLETGAKMAPKSGTEEPGIEDAAKPDEGVGGYRPEEVPGRLMLNWIWQELSNFWASFKAGICGMLESVRHAIWGRWRR
jgi:hypothetical protein